MSKLTMLTALTAVLSAPAVFADTDLWQRETLTEGFFGLNDYLDDYGIEVAAGVTQIIQKNTKGGLSTHHSAGQYSGSYDLEVTIDTSRYFDIEGGTVYIHTEGFWGKSPGIDPTAVGSYFGVNADAANRDAMIVTELWYEQNFFNGFKLRFGKLDITGGFDCRGCPVTFDGNAYANDETTQFLNSAFVNNPTIPFPDYGLGAILHYEAPQLWYASIGIADAQADMRETGFNTAFHDEDYWFSIAEFGVTPTFESDKGPLPGAYRIGMWYDPQPKAHSDSSELYRDDTGFYLSLDQMLWKENSNPDCSQGLGGFFRYGHADSRKNDVTNFYSLGFQYKGPFEGRDNDVVAIGYARGTFSDRANTTYRDDYESVIEIYYSAAITPWLNITPSIQYIKNTGGTKLADDATVLGLRIQMYF